MKRPILTRILAALVCMTVLAACVSPTLEGSVVAGPMSQDEGRAPSAQALVDPPAEGATPQEVVDGFLRAPASAARDYEVARMFLAESALQSWQPYAKTTVFSSLSEVQQTNPDPTDPLPGQPPAQAPMRPAGRTVIHRMLIPTHHSP